MDSGIEDVRAYLLMTSTKITVDSLSMRACFEKAEVKELKALKKQASTLEQVLNWAEALETVCSQTATGCLLL